MAEAKLSGPETNNGSTAFQPRKHCLTSNLPCHG